MSVAAARGGGLETPVQSPSSLMTRAAAWAVPVAAGSSHWWLGRNRRALGPGSLGPTADFRAAAGGECSGGGRRFRGPVEIAEPVAAQRRTPLLAQGPGGGRSRVCP